VDIENVCVAGREIAAEEGFSDRINYQPVDIIRDVLPTGFDMILQCDVGLFGLELIKKYYRSLNPGGRFVFVGHLSPTEYSAPPTRVEWTFIDSLREPDFGYPTLAELKTQLIETGFEILPGHHTIGSGWIVLQARR
jgi:SAM-dependent methyltransferase